MRIYVRVNTLPTLGVDRVWVLQPGHPLVTDGWPCPACNATLGAGDRVVPVLLGPGDDPDAQAKAQAGRWYSGAVVMVHAACAGLTEEQVAAALARETTDA